MVERRLSGRDWRAHLVLFCAAGLAMGWALSAAVAAERSARTLAAAAAVLLAAVLAVVRSARVLARELHAARAGTESGVVALAHASRELVWESDAGGRFVYVGPNVSEYLGYEADELVGRQVQSVFAPMDRDRARALGERGVRRGEGWRDERYHYLAKDGSIRELSSSGWARTDRDGKFLGYSGTLARLRGEAQLQSQQARLERVRAVIAERAVRTVYQPIVSTARWVSVGTEALARFPAAYGDYGPDRWFTDAVACGHGPDLELLAVETAFAGAVGLPHDHYLSINLSPATILSGRVAEVLRRSGWQPSRLVVEITEHVSVADYPLVRRVLEPLRAAGTRLAVDDVGAGYASFRHVLDLAPDHIKLDRTLIAGLEADAGRQAAVRATVRFARDIGAVVVAEGVETDAELRMAAALGADAVQGYAVGRPGPLVAIAPGPAAAAPAT